MSMPQCMCVAETPRGTVLETFTVGEVYHFRKLDLYNVQLFRTDMVTWESVLWFEFRKYFIRL